MLLLFRGRGCCVFGLWRLFRYLTLNPAPNLRCPCCQLRRAFREEPPKTFGDSLPCSRALSTAGVHGWPLPASAPQLRSRLQSTRTLGPQFRGSGAGGALHADLSIVLSGTRRTPCGTAAIASSQRPWAMRLRCASFRNQR